MISSTYPLVAAVVVAELLPLLLLLVANLVLALLQCLLLPSLCISSLLEAIGLKSSLSSVQPGWPVVYQMELILLIA